MDIFTSLQFWIAILTGGTAVKIIDYLLPHMLNRGKNRRENEADERNSLRDDITWLREEIGKQRVEIGELRGEVDSLRNELGVTQKELSVWQRRYWSKKTALDKIVAQVNSLAAEDVRRKVLDTAALLEIEEESSQTDN